MLTEQEKDILKSLLEYHIKRLKEGKDSINEYPTPKFLAGEEKYEDVLERIIKKL